MVPTLLSSILIPQVVSQNNDPIIPSDPSDVYIEEIAEYDAPIGDSRPIVHLNGILFWERLSGNPLRYFINTSDVISKSFWDHDTGAPLTLSENCWNGFTYELACLQDIGDRYLIVPEFKSFEYEIDAYYDPDIIHDTGMIVIFNSQSVDFSLVVDGEDVYARVDYRNEIILPLGAGIVSLAPIDSGLYDFEKIEDGRYKLVWEYKHRAMDSKHDPLMIEVTYSYDEIYVALTEKIIQGQGYQRTKREEEQRLNLLNASFVVIATLALVASILSVLFAYLIARRNFEPKLRQAKDLPRRAVSDIEDSDTAKIPVKSMFLSLMIIIPVLFAPVGVQAQIELDTVGMRVVMDLKKDPQELLETTTLSLPISKEYIYIYANTSEVLSFNAKDEFGNNLRVVSDASRFTVYNPGFEVTYELKRSYIVHNNSRILVFMDRIWSEYSIPVADGDDEFFNVDLFYSVILPEGAYLFSASPSDIMSIENSEGRLIVSFVNEDIQMDAFHDVFETQITFSYADILDILDDPDSSFQSPNPVSNETRVIIDIVQNEIFLFSLLGLIAPLLSFILAYWVFRRRYQKLIERTEKLQEENIYVENAHIEALSVAIRDSEGDITKSFIGHYWKLVRPHPGL